MGKQISRSVTAEQYRNPSQTTDGSGTEEKYTAEYNYRVITVKNVLSVSIGQYLFPSEVQKLIDEGVDVTIK